MPSINACVSSHGDDPMEITRVIGPLFLLDHFFNVKHGKPYLFSSLSGTQLYTSAPGLGRIYRDKQQVVLGSAVAEVYLVAYVKTEELDQQSNLIVPAVGDDVRMDDCVTVRIICSEEDYSETDDDIRVRIELWTCGYSYQEQFTQLDWMIESRMAEPMSWLTFNKHTHEIAIS